MDHHRDGAELRQQQQPGEEVDEHAELVVRGERERVGAVARDAFRVLDGERQQTYLYKANYNECASTQLYASRPSSPVPTFALTHAAGAPCSQVQAAQAGMV